MNIQICKNGNDIEGPLKSFVSTWKYWSYADLKTAMQTKTYTLYFTGDKDVQGALLTQTNVDSVDVIYIYTNPTHRRQGLALSLLKECERILREEGHIEKMFLEVRTDNVPAQKVYEVFGMKVINRRSKYYKDGCDALIYCKEF